MSDERKAIEEALAAVRVAVSKVNALGEHVILDSLEQPIDTEELSVMLQEVEADLADAIFAVDVANVFGDNEDDADWEREDWEDDEESDSLDDEEDF